jgi:Cys-rich four helix bundle protein (predicted Tat secretion target)
MDRRNLLLAAGGAALATSTRLADAQHEAHQHGAAGSALLDSALQCVKTGELCQAHCFALFAEGDKSVAACARSVNTLTSVCGTLAVLAAEHSPALPRYASVAKDVCKACEDECRKHADKHAPCKACAEACAACAQECGKIAT